MATVGELRWAGRESHVSDPVTCQAWNSLWKSEEEEVMGLLLSDMPILFLHFSPGNSIYSRLLCGKHLMTFHEAGLSLALSVIIWHSVHVFWWLLCLVWLQCLVENVQFLNARKEKKAFWSLLCDLMAQLYSISVSNCPSLAVTWRRCPFVNLTHQHIRMRLKLQQHLFQALSIVSWMVPVRLRLFLHPTYCPPPPPPPSPPPPPPPFPFCHLSECQQRL